MNSFSQDTKDWNAKSSSEANSSKEKYESE